MAQRTIVVLTDDVDGSESDAVETVSFSLDGVSYEIDLGPKNKDRLVKAFSAYTDAGRRVSRGTGRSAGGRKARAAKRDDLDAVRAWAGKNGHTVSPRGRVAQSVLDAYDARKK